MQVLPVPVSAEPLAAVELAWVQVRELARLKVSRQLEKREVALVWEQVPASQAE